MWARRWQGIYAVTEQLLDNPEARVGLGHLLPIGWKGLREPRRGRNQPLGVLHATPQVAEPPLHFAFIRLAGVVQAAGTDSLSPRLDYACASSPATFAGRSKWGHEG